MKSKIRELIENKYMNALLAKDDKYKGQSLPKNHGLVHLTGYGMVTPDQRDEILARLHSVIDQKEIKLGEATQQTVTMTVPMLIRALEWSREDAKDDVQIHKFVENMISAGGTLDTDDYAKLLPESEQIDEVTKVLVHKIVKNARDKIAAQIARGDLTGATDLMKKSAFIQSKLASKEKNRKPK
jgi:hypothetical protein